jgi:hypothetical protein
MIREADVIPDDLYYLGLFHLNLTSIGKSHEIFKQKPDSIILGTKESLTLWTLCFRKKKTVIF